MDEETEMAEEPVEEVVPPTAAGFPEHRWRHAGAAADELRVLAAEFTALPEHLREAERLRVAAVSRGVLAEELDKRRAGPSVEADESAPSAAQSAATGGSTFRPPRSGGAPPEPSESADGDG
jgi:hypothetical protein